MNMATYAFIPARYQSSRFPGKPLALIAGKPMIQRVYECALSCPELSEIFVATDDKRIFSCVRDFGGKAIMTRKGHNSGTDRITEAAQTIGLNDQDLVVNIQGDQPVFDPSFISALVKPLMEDMSIHIATLKHKFEYEDDVKNRNHVKVVVDGKGFALYFSRSPIPFFP